MHNHFNEIFMLVGDKNQSNKPEHLKKVFREKLFPALITHSEKAALKQNVVQRRANL